jgi:hypothetical protein
MVFLAIMEQWFELTNDEIEKVRQKLVVALKRKKPCTYPQKNNTGDLEECLRHLNKFVRKTLF